jgi:hypothetical protein
MTAELHLPLYSAVWTRLSTLDVTGETITKAEKAPPNPTLPLCTYAIEFIKHGERAGEAVLRLDIWHNVNVERILAIVDAVGVLFDRKAMQLPTAKAVPMLEGTASIFDEEDGVTRHAVLTFRVLFHK